MEAAGLGDISDVGVSRCWIHSQEHWALFFSSLGCFQLEYCSYHFNTTQFFYMKHLCLLIALCPLDNSDSYFRTHRKSYLFQESFPGYPHEKRNHFLLSPFFKAPLGHSWLPHNYLLTFYLAPRLWTPWKEGPQHVYPGVLLSSTTPDSQCMLRSCLWKQMECLS